jgi:hypothetical protein
VVCSSCYTLHVYRIILSRPKLLLLILLFLIHHSAPFGVAAAGHEPPGVKLFVLIKQQKAA